MSHLLYTESAESSRAETIQDAYNRTFLIGQLYPVANGNVCYILGRNKLSGIFQARKVLEVKSLKSV